MPAQKININHKLIAITGLSLLGMCIIIFLFYEGLASSIKEEKMGDSRRLVDIGMQIITHFYDQAARLELTETDAKSKAINMLGAVKFNTNRYFWVNNSNGEELMHPNRGAQTDPGMSLLDLTDVKGAYFVRDFIETARQGGGFVDYYWHRPDSSEPTLKISYVDYFEPWDWILGTGIYLEDIKHETRHYAYSALRVVLVFALIMVALSLTLTRKTLHQLKKISIHDPLTSLYTRGYMDEHIEQLMALHKRGTDKYLSVIFLDLDHFKRINDTYGHACGDQVLSRVGKKIREISRPSDLCVRYGGEEFVVVVMSEDRHSARRLAERIRADVQALTFNHDNVDFKITLSAGIAVRKGFESFKTVLLRADERLYEAKAKGRNCIIDT